MATECLNNLESSLTVEPLVVGSLGHPDLVVVMPFYNEEASLEHVLSQWVEVVGSCCPNYEILLVADCPSDNSLNVVKRLLTKNHRLVLLENPHNIGHGQSCVRGYTYALAVGADWVLQVDSDGQCDPKYFPTFWGCRGKGPLHQGLRSKRCDGRSRWLASRALELLIYVRTGRLVRDPNCPYRLMRADVMGSLVGKIPPSFDLANVALSYLFKKNKFFANYLPIVFLNRFGGVPSVPPMGLLKKVFQLWTDFLTIR